MKHDDFGNGGLGDAVGRWWATLDTRLADPLPRGRSTVVGAMLPSDLRWLAEHQAGEAASAALAVEDKLIVGAKQLRHQKARNALLESEWRALPGELDRPAAVYWDTPSAAVVYDTAGDAPTKVAVEFKGAGPAERVNRVLTAFRVSQSDVASMVKRGDWILMRGQGA